MSEHTYFGMLTFQFDSDDLGMKQQLLALAYKLDYTFAAKTLVVLPILLLIFHTGILLGVIPHAIVWGGRLNDTTVYIFEPIAIVMNVILLIIGLTKSRLCSSPISLKITDRTEWFMVWFLLVNTLLNPLSATWFEALIFTPIVGFYCLCLFRVVYLFEERALT